MRSRLLLPILLLVLAGIAAWRVLGGSPSSPASDPSDHSGANEAAAADLAVSGNPPPPDRERLSAPESPWEEPAVAASAPIRGRVLDRAGDPIEGATVALLQRDEVSPFALQSQSGAAMAAVVRTDRDGRFVLRGLPGNGVWTVHAWHPDFTWVEGPAIRGNREAEQELPPIVLGEGFLVEGIVVEPSGAPRAGARVEIMHEGLSPDLSEGDPLGRHAVTVSDAAGAFSFTGLGPGAWTLSATSESFGMAWLSPLVLTEGALPPPTRLRLSPEFRYSGRVVTADGAGIPDALLVLEGSHGGLGPNPSARSDAAGQFAFRGVREGSWILKVACAGFLASRPLELADASQEDIRIELTRAGAIHGRVLTPAGCGPARLEIWSTTRGQAPYVPTGMPPWTAEGDGTFSFTPPSTGSHVLLVQASGASSRWSAPFQASANTIDLGSIELGRGAGARGRVVTGDGRPVVGALLQAREPAWSPDSPAASFGWVSGDSALVPPAAARSDARGEFLLQDLALDVGAISCESSAIATIAVSVRLVAGQVVDLGEIVAESAGSLEVSVTRADGSALAGGTVLLQREGEVLGLQPHLLDAFGRVSIPGLRSGDWWIRAVEGASALGRGSPRQRIWVGPGATERVSIQLGRDSGIK